MTEGAYPNNVPDADQYLFWDYVHPTTRVHEMIGELAFATVTAVPEPDSLCLAVVGLIGLAGAQRRGQRTSALNT